ncbi:hypothetical protein [Rubinisphaera margarita]|uniref:hypothetical protein n=1 Tax=Rubinisphaera margarita TaxID=2909586 RepID=UPI001EE8B4DD|nr:hypothetical protein [Rubinisphaera margarita]MCG6156340.1 hypothetical protein [Rubinisphaera margarita]
MKQKTTLCIETIDGREQNFHLPAPVENERHYSIASKIEKFLFQQSIALIVDDELIVIPMHQVKSLSISPLRNKLPENVVVTATRASVSCDPLMADRLSA